MGNDDIAGRYWTGLNAMISAFSYGEPFSKLLIGEPVGNTLVVAPMSVEPGSVAPVGSRVIGIAGRAIVITARVVRRPVKDWNRDRDRQTETNKDPCLSLGLSEHRDCEDHRRQNNSFFHTVTRCRRKPWFQVTPPEVPGVQGLQESWSCGNCRIVSSRTPSYQ